MRKLVVAENITLDGVIEATEGWFSVTGGADTADLEATVREQMAAEDSLLLGRQTFEDFRGYWPEQTDDTTGVTAHLNRVSKYVVSGSLKNPEWENTTVLRGDLAAEVQTLKEQLGGEIGVTGSITLVHDLVAAGLVDEYRLFVYPVVLGHGKRLFEDATAMPELELLEAKPFRSGVVLLSYRAVSE